MAPEPCSQTDREDRIDEVVFAYLKAVESGQTPDRQEILARHADLADDLAQFFANQDRLNPFDSTLLTRLEDTAIQPPEVELGSFGGYELLERIPAGGMSIVFKARQISPPRFVALKMILPSRSSPADVQRFIRETEDMSNLDHAHIVPIYQVDSRDGQPYFSMKWMEGGSLASRINEFRLPLVNRKTGKDEEGKAWSSAQMRKRQRQIARLVATVARAIHHAHQRRILHRDLKPGNILLDGARQPHVTDFGLARRIGNWSGETPPASLVGKTQTIENSGNGAATETNSAAMPPTESYSRLEADTLALAPGVGLTGSGAIAGTPPYMSPEQAAGSKVLTTAVDVYGLGAVLYELLTGRPPFRARTPRDTLLEVIHKELKPPRAINPAISKDLQAICEMCLAKLPEKRYGSAEKLAEDLERFVEGRPVTAWPVGRAQRVIKWAKRRPMVAALTIAVVLLTVVGVSGVGWHSWQVNNANEKMERVLYVNRVRLADRYIADGQLHRADDTLDLCPNHLRQWEWFHLKSLCRQETIELRGHTAAVLSVQFRLDGKRVVTASQDGTAILWDPATRRVVHKLEDHQGWVNSACFSRDGNRIFTAGNDQKVKIWDADKGQFIRDLKVEGQLVCASRKSSRIAVLARDNSVTVLEEESGQIVYSKRQESEVISIALSPDGRFLAVGGYEKMLKLYDTQSETERSLSFPIGQMGANNIWSVDFSANGEYLAAGSSILGEWPVAGGEARFYSGRGELQGLSLAYSSDEAQLAATDRQGVVRIWNRDNGRSGLAPRKYNGIIPSMAFNPTDNHYLAVTRGSIVTIDNINPVVVHARRLVGHTSKNLAAVAFDASGENLVSRAGAKEVLLWDLANGKSTILPTPDAGIPERANLAVNWSQNLLVSGSDGEKLQVWDLSSGDESRAKPISIPRTRCSAFSPDGKLLAFTNQDNRIFLWDLQMGKSIRDWSGGGSDIYWLAFRPKSKCIQLVSGSHDGTVRLWDATERVEELRRFDGHRLAVTCVALSPDGRRMATSSADVTVRVWDVDGGRELYELAGHSSYVSCVAFSPDGRRVASCGNDGMVKLWDADSGEEVLTLTGNKGYATALAFSPDGHRLACCGSDGTVYVWEAPPLED